MYGRIDVVGDTTSDGVDLRVSLENLMSFPFVREAVENDMLALHGLWTEIGEGELEYFDTKTSTFLPV